MRASRPRAALVRIPPTAAGQATGLTARPPRHQLCPTDAGCRTGLETATGSASEPAPCGERPADGTGDAPREETTAAEEREELRQRLSEWLDLPMAVLALLLRVFGVAIFGYLTARIASYFVGQQVGEREAARGAAERSDLLALRDEVASLRASVETLRRPGRRAAMSGALARKRPERRHYRWFWSSVCNGTEPPTPPCSIAGLSTLASGSFLCKSSPCEVRS